MNATTRINELNKAREQAENAMRMYHLARTAKAKRAALEDFDFWGNKVVFLSNPKIED